jgi:hypothetical protein
VSGEPVYEADPHARPDADFEPGTVAHVVAGNRGRLLDPRRTPLLVAGAVPQRAAFEVVVAGFEDAGAHWELALCEVSRMQFERGGGRLTGGELADLQALAELAQRPLEVPAPAHARTAALADLGAERERVRDRLAAAAELRELDLGRCVRERRGEPAAAAALLALLQERDLTDLERSFARTYVSNPASREVVKGHAIVLAEMGLCPYRGTEVRDADLFQGEGSRERRGTHILLRLAFAAELLALLGLAAVELYRGAAIEEPSGVGPGGSFVAATFSREVAMSHFDAARDGLLARQLIPAERVLMTFLETAEMTEPYREAEAVLLGDPGNPLF